jgi:hypothetical protein
MRNRVAILALGLIVAGFLVRDAVLPRASAAREPANASTKWEYRVCTQAATAGGLPDELVSLGQDGWELVAIEPAQPFGEVDHGGGTGKFGADRIQKTERRFYLKRHN